MVFFTAAKCYTIHSEHTQRCKGRAEKASNVTMTIFVVFFCLDLSLPSLLVTPFFPSTPVCLPSYLPWLLSSSLFPSPSTIAFFFLTPFPRRAVVGQTSLVVSSVNFLESLREAEELALITSRLNTRDNKELSICLRQHTNICFNLFCTKEC